MTDDAQQQRPAASPAAKPAVPSPAALARTRPTPGPAAARRETAVSAAPVSDPSKWGRVDDDGTVYVRTAEGERAVGSWKAGEPAEGLAHFGLRFDDLATEVGLLEARLDSHPQEARKVRTNALTIGEGLPTAAVVGDLESLQRRINAVVERSHTVESEAKARKEAARAEAIARKEALATEAEEIGQSSTQWKPAGDRLREMFDEWKSIKGIDRKTDDELWKRFSKAREEFNKRRGSHFAELDRTRAVAKKLKEELVQRAESIKDSTEWNETATAFRQLMDEWKAAGRAPKDADNALWTKFKAAQDAFFEARHAAAAERDAEFEANAKAKTELLEQYESRITPGDDLGSAKSALRELQARWEEIGKVPRGRIGELEGRIRALEKSVTDAEESEWRRNDPEVKARAEQFWIRVKDFEQQAAKAEAAGKTKDAEKARVQATQWREWAVAAENAVENR